MPQTQYATRFRNVLAYWLSRDGLGYLLLFLLIAAALWAFIGIADEVMEGGSKAFDRALLLSLRTDGNPDDPLGPLWLEQWMRDLTALGGTVVLTLITAGAIGFLLLERKPRTAAFLLLAILGGTLISLALKAGFDRPRPDFLVHGDIVYTASFPSGHSMNSAVVYLLIGAILARAHRSRAIKVYLLACAILITVLVGFSRMYLGVHWPTDVAAGWTAGAAWALLCWLLAYHMQRRRLVEREAELLPEEVQREEPGYAGQERRKSPMAKEGR
jgi:undecaprenyl-diphosphatase